MSVNVSRSILGPSESSAVQAVLDIGYLGMGAETGRFEDELSVFMGLRDAGREIACVASGTAALHLALEAVDAGPGHEVIIPSLTYLASFQAVAATGARAVACDVRVSDGCIDPEDLRRRISDSTIAVMPVHYSSVPGPLAEVYEIAAANNLRVIEDAAHAFGCASGNGLVGCKGDVVCFSFDGIKNITAGEGGAVVSADAEVMRRVRDGRLLGVEGDTDQRLRGERSWVPAVTRRGFRYHMSDIMASIGRAQLARLMPEFAPARIRLLRQYRVLLEDVDGIQLLDDPPEGTIPHIFPVRVLRGRRDEVRLRLVERGCGVGIHYHPNHLIDLFRTAYQLPGAETLGRELLSLPLHPGIDDETQRWVVSELQRSLEQTAEEGPT
jgi:dTDP-4-amino-4,6-dideoxygalactose transaminase